MQDSEKLRKILAEARILENRIREAIPTFNSDLGVLKKLKQEISQFITSNQASGHFDYIENQSEGYINTTQTGTINPDKKVRQLLLYGIGSEFRVSEKSNHYIRYFANRGY